MEQTISVHGREHSDTIRAIYALSETYMSQKRWEKAEPLQKEIVDLSLKVLGEGHPDTIRYTRQCATVYRNLGKSEDALRMENLLSSMSTKQPGIRQVHSVVK